MNIKQITIDILNKFIIEIKKDENMQKIKENICDPAIDYIFQSLYPYLVVTSIIFILTFILAIAIFYMLFKSVR